jgi:hypothetical protein
MVDIERSIISGTIDEMERDEPMSGKRGLLLFGVLPWL